MRFPIHFSLAVLALTIGCDNAPAQNNGYGNHHVSQAVPVETGNNDDSRQPAGQNGYDRTSQTQNNGGEEITMYPTLHTETGRPLLYTPFPTVWKMIAGAQPGQPGIKGPNGLSITEYPTQAYMYTNDPNTNQIYQSYGQNVMAPVGIEAVISQQLIPQGQQMGMTLLNQYPLPSVAANDAAFGRKVSDGSSQNIDQAAGLDWTDSEGNKVLVVLHYTEMRAPSSIFWNYTVAMLTVQPSNFEKAKNQYIYGLSNKVFNQSEINYHNTKLANKLKADNDNFQANQKIIRDGQEKRRAINAEATEYVRNSNKASYEYRQHNNEVLQEQMGNALNDVNVVVSPYDGKEYQVESGSQTYWINDEGKYIQSDDLFFDPNDLETHPGVWQKAPQKEYK